MRWTRRKGGLAAAAIFNTCVFLGSAVEYCAQECPCRPQSQRCWGRTSAKNCGTAPTPFTGHPKALRPLLLGDTFFIAKNPGEI